MQILLFTDIHIHAHKQSLQRLQDCLDVLRWTFETARKRNIKNVLFLGDLFHDRQKIQIITYHNTFQIFQEYRDLNIKLLLGNHDLWFYDKWDISSVSPLSALSNVEVIDKPCSVDIDGFSVDFLPFTHDPIDVLKVFSGKKSDILCGHVALDGAILNSLYSTTAEVSIESEKDVIRVSKEIFEGWKKVFLGHFHFGQKIKDSNIEYIGSPLELSFGEAFQDKHVVIFDTDTFECEYVKNTFSPKHLIIKPNEVANHNLDNCFVQIQVENIDSSDTISMRKKLSEKHKTNSLEFKEIKNKTIKETSATLQTKFDFVEGDILEKYISTVGTDLDKKLLLEIGKEIINEN